MGTLMESNGITQEARTPLEVQRLKDAGYRVVGSAGKGKRDEAGQEAAKGDGPTAKEIAKAIKDAGLKMQDVQIAEGMTWAELEEAIAKVKAT